MEEFDGRKFNIFDTEYTIKIVDSIPVEQDNMFLFGSTDGLKKEILIARKPNGIEQSDKSMQLTLVHELVHAIFGEGCYEANQDEPLVEWTAKCIVSLIKQEILTDYGSNYKNKPIPNTYN